MKPQAVITDGYTLNPGDLDWSPLKEIVDLTAHDLTTADELISRAKKAEILLVNKTIIGDKEISSLPSLKCVVVTATGYNNIDIDALKENHIAAYHAKGYGRDSVAQQVFAYIFHFTNRVADHSQSVKQGDWQRSPNFSYFLYPMRELHGMTLGVYGYGPIGRRVAEIGKAMGMNVLVHSSRTQDNTTGIQFVDLEALFSQSDFISLNTRLTKSNKFIINKSLLSLMKPSAYLINTARAQLINEEDLYYFLHNHKISGAALDVLSEEPPKQQHPLMTLDNCLITPHNAWATWQSRKRLLDISIQNVQDFVNGNPSNNRIIYTQNN